MATGINVMDRDGIVHRWIFSARMSPCGFKGDWSAVPCGMDITCPECKKAVYAVPKWDSNKRVWINE